MKTFDEYINEQEKMKPKKPWQAKKADILKFWRNAQAKPIVANPVPIEHRGSRFRSDGVRITGTSYFINSILARIKDVIRYEDQEGTRLDVEYREIPVGKFPDYNKLPKYVFYLHIEEER